MPIFPKFATLGQSCCSLLPTSTPDYQHTPSPSACTLPEAVYLLPCRPSIIQSPPDTLATALCISLFPCCREVRCRDPSHLPRALPT